VGVVINRDGTRQLLDADTVVLATGFFWDDSLHQEFNGLAPEFYPVKGAALQGHLIQGIAEAFELAMRV
jgi:hypothetical protein